ncbi:hypothetical protein HLH12_00335 [Acinetobacter sp. NIPH 2377]|uniref:hypothetical protein n=1 Tax=Acinetobacter terrestris TaxID=2529843 RepID=UPI00148F5158|nr:hypothetical protein [Acinetobacter terrestris]NNH34036.1 hypothetical protein [Acinetobacter terrestris]
MNEALEKLCNELVNVGELVKNSWADDRTLKDVYGWSHVALTRHDLAMIPLTLVEKIKKVGFKELEDDIYNLLTLIPDRLQTLYPEVIPHMFNGNGAQAVPIYLSTLDWVNQAISPLFSWEVLQDNKAMPTALARRLRSIQTDLENLIPNKDTLSDQITLIHEATEAAENLPADLQSLKEARHKVSELEKESSYDRKKVTEHKSSVEAQLKTINDLHEQAEQLIENCEDAYRITTTKGLAAAFDQRASDLKWSMRFWVGGLFGALFIGAWIGHERIQILTTSLNSPNLNWGVIWIHIILSMTSVIAPLWFAWLATKQIGQRFRLAEDYDFKASVAKAYEGYKKEAAKIDEDFEARLFNVALTRLEEAPLRLLDDRNHGSPSHELLDKSGLNKIGGKIVTKVEDAIDSLKPAKASNDN